MPLPRLAPLAASAYRCKYCFTNYTLSPAPPSGSAMYDFPVGPLFMVNTSEVVDKCDCVGAFPVPENVCLEELDYLSGCESCSSPLSRQRRLPHALPPLSRCLAHHSRFPLAISDQVPLQFSG